MPPVRPFTKGRFGDAMGQRQDELNRKEDEEAALSSPKDQESEWEDGPGLLGRTTSQRIRDKRAAKRQQEQMQNGQQQKPGTASTSAGGKGKARANPNNPNLEELETSLQALQPKEAELVAKVQQLEKFKAKYTERNQRVQALKGTLSEVQKRSEEIEKQSRTVSLELTKVQDDSDLIKTRLSATKVSLLQTQSNLKMITSKFQSSEAKCQKMVQDQIQQSNQATEKYELLQLENTSLISELRKAEDASDVRYGKLLMDHDQDLALIREEKNQVEMKLIESSTEIDHYQAELLKVTTEKTQVEQTNENLLAELENASTKEERLQQQITFLENLNKQSANELEQQKEISDKLNSSLLRSNQEARAELHQLSKSLIHAEWNSKALYLPISNLSSDKDSLVQQRNELQSSIRGLKGKLHQLETTNPTYQTSLTTQSAEAHRLEVKIDGLEARLSQFVTSQIKSMIPIHDLSNYVKRDEIESLAPQLPEWLSEDVIRKLPSTQKIDQLSNIWDQLKSGMNFLQNSGGTGWNRGVNASAGSSRLQGNGQTQVIGSSSAKRPATDVPESPDPKRINLGSSTLAANSSLATGTSLTPVPPPTHESTSSAPIPSVTTGTAGTPSSATVNSNRVIKLKPYLLTDEDVRKLNRLKVKRDPARVRMMKPLAYAELPSQIERSAWEWCQSEFVQHGKACFETILKAYMNDGPSNYAHFYTKWFWISHMLSSELSKPAPDVSLLQELTTFEYKIATQTEGKYKNKPAEQRGKNIFIKYLVDVHGFTLPP
ncbi:uncharacterized protein L201_006180 [Kwoniella dendrophila CBS 6074]|uniref:Spindle assembly checkpoint component MAD1 n=1 Tax=Kwoniella dendrophila CBS 6074 TaxID=1295534 RepID=A0AAX4K242_9TREE